MAWKNGNVDGALRGLGSIGGDMRRFSDVKRRLPALTGVGFVVLAGAGMLLGDPYDASTNPHPGRPAAALAAALVANRGQARVGAYLTLLGVFFLLWFIAYLYGLLRQADNEAGWVASVALGGGLVAAAVLLLGASMGFATSELADYGADTQVAKTFFVWGWNAANIAAPPMIALVAATTLVSVRHHRFPRWFRVFSMVWTAVLISLLIGNVAGMGAALSLIWVLATSFVLLFDTTPPVEAAAVHEPRKPPVSESR